MKYFQVTVSTVCGLQQSVADALFRCGCEGVEICDPQTDSASTKPELSDRSPVRVLAFFLSDAGFDTVCREIAGLADQDGACPTVSGIWADDAAYENEWKKYYRPVNAGRVAIVPAWMPGNPKKLNVFLDPESSFGSGAHATTAMCLKLLQRAEIKDKTVLDLGCGSGILGITALKLGASGAAFVDVDASAVATCTLNIQKNSVTDRADTFCGDVAAYPGEYDLVVANITADVLTLLSTDACRHVARGGKLILSGIIDRSYADVLETYVNLGFRVKKHKKSDGWHALILERER